MSVRISHQAKPVIQRKVYNFSINQAKFKIFYASVKGQSKKLLNNYLQCSRLPNERRMCKRHFMYIYYKLHLGWHNFWYYQTISSYWCLCVIATRNFTFGGGRTLQQQDWCIIRAVGARKFSIFQCQIAVQRHYFMVSKKLIFLPAPVSPRPPPRELRLWHFSYMQ